MKVKRVSNEIMIFLNLKEAKALKRDIEYHLDDEQGSRLVAMGDPIQLVYEELKTNLKPRPKTAKTTPMNISPEVRSEICEKITLLHKKATTDLIEGLRTLISPHKEEVIRSLRERGDFDEEMLSQILEAISEPNKAIDQIDSV